MLDYVLVADVGGTNARLALCDIATGSLSNQVTYPTEQFSSLELTVEDYLKHQEQKIDKACIAIACPVAGDVIRMTNHNWSFSISAFKEQLGFSQLEVINDFHAAAMAVPILGKNDRAVVSDYPADNSKPVSVLGAGTGLGVAHIFPHNGEWIALPGEGGHAEFAACTDEEYEILKLLHDKFGRVSAERILSGPGLVNLYEALVMTRQRQPLHLSPEAISTHAMNKSCQDCYDTLALFCTILGRFAGSLALTFNSRGGVYLAGGIVPRFIDFLRKSDFQKSFTEKGRFKRYVGDIPVYVVTHEQIGLLGAGAYLRQKLGIVLKPYTE